MITHLGHVAIRARNLEDSVNFYVSVLGVQEAFRMQNAEGVTDIIYLRVGPSQFIELFPGGTEEFQPGPKTIGALHLCFEVDDADKTLDELRRRGMPIDREMATGRSGCKQFWGHDPDGNRLEFMELLPASKQYQANLRLGK